MEIRDTFYTLLTRRAEFLFKTKLPSFESLEVDEQELITQCVSEVVNHLGDNLNPIVLSIYLEVFADVLCGRIQRHEDVLEVLLDRMEQLEDTIELRVGTFQIYEGLRQHLLVCYEHNRVLLLKNSNQSKGLALLSNIQPSLFRKTLIELGSHLGKSILSKRADINPQTLSEIADRIS